MEKPGKTGKIGKLLMVVRIQAVVIVYTMASIFAKLASGEEWFSFPFFLFAGLELLILFLYALAWQQIMKKTELTVAYANRQMYFLWSLAGAVLLFHDEITLTNILGCILAVAGTIVIVGDDSVQEWTERERT